MGPGGFFVNGMLSYAPGGPTMRFLVQSASAGELRVVVWRASGALCATHVQRVEAATPTVVAVALGGGVAPAACERCRYDARMLGSRVAGSFPLVGPASRAPLAFAFVSCNDNCAPSAWNAYRRSTGSAMWRRLAAEAPDAIVHCGDQIYADGALDALRRGDGTLDDAAARVASLYATSFGEPSQQRAMQHALNATILDDHEVADGFGAAADAADTAYAAYAARALGAYRAYQRALVADDDAGDGADAADFTYALALGKYRLVLLDQRSAMRRGGAACGRAALTAIRAALRDGAGCELIVVSPRPLVHVDAVSAWLGVLACVCDARDALTHPAHAAATERVVRLLAAHQGVDGRTVRVVSGDVHCAYVQTHARGGARVDELVASGVSRAPLASEPAYARAAVAAHWWAARALASTVGFAGLVARRALATGPNYGVLTRDGALCVRA